MPDLRPLLGIFAVVLAGAIPAQGIVPLPGLRPTTQDPSRRGTQNQPFQQSSTSPLAPPPRWPGDPPSYRPGFQGLESVFPSFPGFPTYPAGRGPTPRELPALSERYPVVGEWRPRPFVAEERAWPAWLADAVGKTEPRPELAILARNADRVWFLAPGEGAFVPLAFHDKFRVLETGAVVEVRDKGGFEVVFHDGASLRSLGPVRLELLDLGVSAADLRLERLRRVWLQTRTRETRILLPDGSRLEFGEAEGTVYLEAVGGRGYIHNQGKSPVAFTGRFGTIDLQPARRLDFLLAEPSGRYVPPDLQLEGSVRVVRTGRGIEARAHGAGGRVAWSGARFVLTGGESVRIDPLAGTSFPETSPPVAPAAPATPRETARPEK